MTGRELYCILQLHWSHKTVCVFGHFSEPWEELPRCSAAAWERCAYEIGRAVSDSLPLTQEGFKLEKLWDLEERVIRDRLAMFNGNRPLAAASLGVTLKTLYNRVPVEKHTSEREV